MRMRQRREDLLDGLAARIGRADAVTAHLMLDVTAQACLRFAMPDHAHDAIRIRHFIRDGAWTDAVLALIELELPRWSVRSIIREGAEWICVLSNAWPVADWLDDNVEGRNEELPLAMLAAFVEALRFNLSCKDATSGEGPNAGLAQQQRAVCCDNFGR